MIMKKLIFLPLIILNIVLAASIDQIEYFIDSDPGIGNGISIAVTTPTENIDQHISLDLSGVNGGFHYAGIRVLEYGMGWSQTSLTPFYKTSVNGDKISKLEYSFDTQAAMWYDYELSDDNDIDQTIAIPLPYNLGNGFHFLQIRAIDDYGKKSTLSVVPFFVTNIPGSNIVAGEYFFDTDPGLGSGTALQGITAGDSVDVVTSLAVGALSNGIHTVFTRFRDDKGSWTIAGSSMFLKEHIGATSVTEAEYFIDTDPGLGNATSIPITAGNYVDHELTVPVDTLTDGIHNLVVRVRDNTGHWSLATSRSFVKITMMVNNEISAAEYFIDDDPGLGNATSLPITTTDSLDYSFSVEVDTLSDGIHNICVRVRDQLGCWSHATHRSFMKISFEQNQEITACEYFIDDDPGYGNATSIAITQSDSVGRELNISIPDTLSDGVHTICVRSRNSQNLWGLTAFQPFAKITEIDRSNIVALDYYITDANLDTVLINSYTSFEADTSIDERLNIDVSSLSLGSDYVLNIKAIDGQNIPSMTDTSHFTMGFDFAAPVAPQDLSVLVENRKVRLDFTANTEPDLRKYIIYRSTSPAPTTQLAVIDYPTAADTVYFDSTIVSGTTYYYRMKAFDYDENGSDYSAEVSINPFWGPKWYVSVNGSDDTGNGSLDFPFLTIQYGMNTVLAGDTVAVLAGTYNEDINFNGKNLVVLGQDGAASTTIQGSGNNTVVTFANNETNLAVLEGFLITGGNGTGGGIICDATSPYLKNLIIAQNTGSNGGGMYVYNGSAPILQDVTIRDNSSNFACAINSQLSSISMNRVIVSDNSGSHHADLYLNNSQINIKNSTFTNNSDILQGSIYCISSSIDTMMNSIMWNNGATNIKNGSFGTPNSAFVAYSNIENGMASVNTNGNGTITQGNGNLDDDPLFVNPTNDYHLTTNSPCIDTGNPDLDNDGLDWNSDTDDQDPDGTRMDIGARFFDQNAGDTTPPAIPQNLTVTAGTFEASLSWSANSETDLNKYNIYRGTSSPATTLIGSCDQATPDTFFTDTGLTGGETYFYRITAVDYSDNESGYSNEASVSIEDIGTTTNIIAAQRTDGSQLVDINYDLAGNSAEYYISVSVSFNSGTDYTEISATYLSGDFGDSITLGTGKQITWDVGAEYDDVFSNTTRIRIDAEPATGATGTVMDIDGNVYQTVKIGEQWWMAENLKVTRYRNGDDILKVTDNGAWDALSTGAYCNYNNDDNNADTYGSLYNWHAVGDSREIAPNGWHVATDEEIKQLEVYIGMNQSEADQTVWRGTDEGTKLKSTTNWNSGGNGTDIFGFGVLPGGYRSTNGDFSALGDNATFWSTTVNNTYYAWYRYFNYNYTNINRNTMSMDYGFSVRCVRD